MSSDDIKAEAVAALGKDNEAKDGACAYEASAKFIEELTSKCDEVQAKVLTEILSQNVETEYLKRHGMSLGHIDRETFKINVPVVAYEDIKSDILRIYNGDFSPILCAQPITELWVSSGTSDGQRKMIPITDNELLKRHDLLTSVMPFIKRRIEGQEPDKGKTFTLLITRDETITPGGLLSRPALTCIFKDPRFYKDNPYPCNTNTSLIEAIHCPDHFQSIYTQLLYGIYQRHDVTCVKVVFGSNLVWGIHFLKIHYSDICHDIHSGSLNQKITDPCLRSSMVETFMQQPQPELAKFIESLCTSQNWEGILQKIWPNIKYLESIVTGSMAQYIPILDYYSGGLPLVSTKYSSSECDLGFNVNPMCDPYDVSYTIMPNMAYYEFIPLNSENDEDSSQQIELVDMANVEVGQEYELVVTNFSGLFRYRMGDVLCPTGFYNSTPQFKFVRRRNVVLSIDADKTTESELHNAIEKASNVLRPHDTIILDYTSNACTKTIPGHYVIYMELMTKSQANGLGMSNILEECCLTMEESLGLPYRAGRVDHCIGPIEIRVVSNGTFEKLRDDAISRGSSFTQFKMPRCVKLLPMLELLNSSVVSTHFSPSMPHCRP